MTDAIKLSGIRSILEFQRRRAAGFRMVRDQAIHDFDQARCMCGEGIATVHAIGDCQIIPAVGVAHGIDALAVPTLMESGRMAMMIKSRCGLLGYDQRSAAHCASGILFSATPPFNLMPASPGRQARSTAPTMDYFISRRRLVALTHTL